MTAFLIAEVKVTDDAWVPDYAAKVHEIAAKHGGRYLSRSGNIETLEGNTTDVTLIALISFPTVPRPMPSPTILNTPPLARRGRTVLSVISG